MLKIGDVYKWIYNLPSGAFRDIDTAYLISGFRPEKNTIFLILDNFNHVDLHEDDFIAKKILMNNKIYCLAFTKNSEIARNSDKFFIKIC